MSEEKNGTAPATPSTKESTETQVDNHVPVGNGNGVAGKDHAEEPVIEKDHVLQKEQTHADSVAHGDAPNKLQQELTLSESIDLENRMAFKGDDSDGKIEWTIRKVDNTNLMSIVHCIRH